MKIHEPFLERLARWAEVALSQGLCASAFFYGFYMAVFIASVEPNVPLVFWDQLLALSFAVLGGVLGWARIGPVVLKECFRFDNELEQEGEQDGAT